MTVQHELHRKTENFPVASLLIPAKYRPAILALYDFARGADEIADAPNLPASERLATLESLEKALIHCDTQRLPRWAQPYALLLPESPHLLAHGEHLLHAFKQDCLQTRYETMDDLLGYCRFSATPIGRAMLDICQEYDADRDASDALCCCLQLLNHLQDVREDYTERGRIYLPQTLMRAYGVHEQQCQASHMSASMRLIYNALLDQCDHLLAVSASLSQHIRNRRLRLEVATIWHSATQLAAKLRTQDALAQKVQLSSIQKLTCIWRALQSG